MKMFIGSLFAALTFQTDAVTLTVSGDANIFGAGHTAAPAPDGLGAGTLPPTYSFTAGAGKVLTFSSVTGIVSMTVCCYSNDADGNFSAGPTAVTSYGGISGIKHDGSGFLVGVFLGPDEPVDPAPPVLDFSSSALGTSFTQLSPEIGQTFYIGDGLTGTGSGTIQQFNVPTNATRLFLGFADSYGYQGPPGVYYDNGGSLTATFDVATTSASPLSFADCPAGNSWKETGSMNAGRANPRAVLLNDGKVLAVGNGTNTEIYNPATESWTPTGALNVGGFGQTLTRLPDGKVLIAGGGYSSQPTISHADAEIYDPATGLWTTVAPLNAARMSATATLLNNGLVLVVGGFDGTNALASAELYNPVSGVWTVTGSLHTARACATATLLPNGHVLVAGGGLASEISALFGALFGPSFASAEEYDPTTGVWTQVGAMDSARNLHTATLLPNGQVLVAGGWNGFDTNTFINPALTTAELYNPATGTWTVTGSLNAARAAATATLLPDGRVLVAGGALNTNVLSTANLDSAEIYDPVSGTWTTVNSLRVARSGAAAVLLNNGLVLVAGGGDSLSSAELFGYIDLGCNPVTIPDFDPESVDVIGGCGNVVVGGGKVDYTNGCARSRSITYIAVDACNQTNVCGRNYVWMENTTPPILIGASNKVVQCGVCSGGYAFTILHSFPSGANDGKAPHARLLQASDGKFYGVTADGGSNDLGTVFCMNSDGSGYTVLKSFTGADGSRPYRGLIEGADSLLYGTTLAGGSSGYGTVFRMSKDGTFYQVLVNFNGSNGKNPACCLMQDSDGWLYGTTFYGSSGNGNIFKLRPDGTSFSVIKSFGNGSSDGGWPQSGLIEGDNGFLFGTTTRGGNSENGGTIYRISKDGSSFTVIKSLFGSDGDTACSGLTLCSDHYLYGTTVFGGTNTLIPIVNPGDDMLQGSGGPLYGANGRGTIFKLKQDGSDFTVLRQFANGGDGAVPLSTMVEDLNGYLWGTTETGYYHPNNTYNDFLGSVFKIKKDGSDYQIVKNFGSSASGGGQPIEGVIRGTDGAIYGTTHAFGPAGNGTVFKIACNGSEWDFDAPIAVSACGGSNNVAVSELSTVPTNSDGCTYSYVRTWLAVDECGNTNTCSQMVTVADAVPPFVYPVRDKIVDGQQPWTFDTPTGEDACDGGVKISVSVVSTVTNEYCPMKVTRTWAVTDDCGNASLCTQTVTVTGATEGNDTTPPVIDCPAGSIIVPLNTNCELEVPVIHPKATDDFTPASQLTYIQDPLPGSIVPGPCYTVVLTVLDACGNASQCQAQICGEDKTPPKVNYPKAVTVTNCIVPDVLPLVSASDACTDPAKLVFSQWPPAGTSIAAGGNQVSVTVADPSGNTTTVIIPLTSGGSQLFLDKLFNTGVDASRVVLGTGSFDPHYTLGLPAEAAGYYATPNPATLSSGSGWPLSPFNVSGWLVPYPTSLEFYAFLTNGFNTTFTNRFVLPADADPLTASISGRWAANNGAKMYLNGLSAGNQVVPDLTPPAYNHWTAFTINSGFLAYPATNLLYFVVTNSVDKNMLPTPALRVEFTSASANCSTCTPPVILYTTPDQSLPAGGTATFSVTVWGTPTLTYQWYHNNVALTNGGHYSGVDTPNLTVASASLADAGIYYVTAFNGCGGVSSHPRKLTVTKNPGDPWAWWNFSVIGKPLVATIGPDLVLTGTNHFGVSSGTTFDFGLPNVGGKIANVMYVPPLSDDSYIQLPYVGPEDSGTASNYTVVIDVYAPGNATSTTLFGIRDNWGGLTLITGMSPGSPDEQLYLYGMVGETSVNFLSSESLLRTNWNRIAVVVSSTEGTSLYLNGKLTGNVDLPVDGAPFTTESVATVVSSPEGTTAESYVTSIAFFADALTSETIAGLGGPDNGPISLDAVSTGASPMLSTVIFDGMINLSWTDDAYILQETSDLNGDWEDSSMPFEETADAGGKITTTVHVNPASDSVKFYRLKLVP